MSVDFDSSKQRWRVRWREQGRRRTRRFSTREEADALDASRRPEVEPTRPELTIVERAGGNAIYAYATKAGVRYADPWLVTNVCSHTECHRQPEVD